MARERPVHVHHAPLAANQPIDLRGVPGGARLLPALSVADDVAQVVVQHREIAAFADDHLRIGKLIAQDVELAFEELPEVALHRLRPSSRISVNGSK